MKLETFFEKFDQSADAPDAVEKMRELVLQLAVQRLLSHLNRATTPEQLDHAWMPLSTQESQR